MKTKLSVMKINKKTLLPLILIVLLTIFSSGCILDIFETHDEADKITVDYLSKGYYYFEDDNGKSFNQTLWEGDVAPYIKGYTPNKWIYYVQSLDYIEDENDMEIFHNVTETIQRGGGDCEDLSILMARGLHEMGLDVCVVVQKAHVLTGINKNQATNKYKGVKIQFNTNRKTFKYVTFDNYYALETTAKWGIGEYDIRPLRYEKLYVL